MIFSSSLTRAVKKQQQQHMNKRYVYGINIFNHTYYRTPPCHRVDGPGDPMGNIRVRVWAVETLEMVDAITQ